MVDLPDSWGEVDDDISHMFPTMAMESFRAVSIAVKEGRSDDALALGRQYMDQFTDVDENPYEHLTRVGLMFTGIAMRILSGDPTPGDPPDVEFGITVLAHKVGTGELVNDPMIDLAAEASLLAANWKWRELESTMIEKTLEADMRGEGQWLVEFSLVVLTMFLNMNGPELLGWKE